VHLSSTDPDQLTLEIFPKPEAPPRGFVASGSLGLFAQFRTQVKPEKIEARVAKLREADPRPPARIAQEVAEAPEAEAFNGAAEWNIQVPMVTSPAVQRVFLKITYLGDIARVYADGKLMTDDFFKGTTLQIALGRFPVPGSDPDLKLQILPLRKDTPIYLPPSVHISFPPSGQVAELKQVEVVPEYQAVAEIGN